MGAAPKDLEQGPICLVSKVGRRRTEKGVGEASARTSCRILNQERRVSAAQKDDVKGILVRLVPFLAGGRESQ